MTGQVVQGFCEHLAVYRSTAFVGPLVVGPCHWSLGAHPVSFQNKVGR